MRRFAKSEQRQHVARRNRQPIELEAVYTMAVRSRHTNVCQVVMVISDLYAHRLRLAQPSEA